MSQDNIIYVGRKPAMSYVMATLATFNNDHDTVELKARGRAITTAVDAAEITRNRYMVGMEHPEIVIGTEQVEGDKGPRNVSTMTIILEKGESEVPQEVFNRHPRRKKKKEKQPKEEKAEVETEEEPEEKEEVAPEPDKEVSNIKGVGEATEEKLRAAGYDTVSKIAEAESFELALKTGLSEKQVAKIIDAANDV
jgi:archaea-specific DNA-binding protein